MKLNKTVSFSNRLVCHTYSMAVLYFLLLIFIKNNITELKNIYPLQIRVSLKAPSHLISQLLNTMECLFPGYLSGFSAFAQIAQLQPQTHQTSGCAQAYLNTRTRICCAYKAKGCSGGSEIDPRHKGLQKSKC